MCVNVELLTAKEVAGLLKISLSETYVLMRTEIPTVQIGDLRRVRPKDLEAWQHAKRVVPALCPIESSYVYSIGGRHGKATGEE